MNRIEIEDYNSTEINIYTSLNETQLRHYYEPELGGFVAESPNVIMRALDAGYEPLHMLVEDGSWEVSDDGGQTAFPGDGKAGRENTDDSLRRVETMLLRRTEGIPVYVADHDLLKEKCDLQLVRGAMCFMRRKPLPDWRELVRQPAAKRIAVLESVTNPANLGAIFRSAAALGVDGVLMTRDCADPLYRRATRVSMGTVFQLPWTYIDDIKNVLNELRTEGWASAAMALDEHAVTITDAKHREYERLAVLLGAEGYGLKADTIEACDLTVMIPMTAGVDSLNVAAASAVAFWELGYGRH